MHEFSEEAKLSPVPRQATVSFTGDVNIVPYYTGEIAASESHEVRSGPLVDRWYKAARYTITNEADKRATNKEYLP